MFSRIAIRWVGPFVLVGIAGAAIAHNWLKTNHRASDVSDSTAAEPNSKQTRPHASLTALPDVQWEAGEAWPGEWIKYSRDEVLAYGIAVEVTKGVITGVACEDPQKPEFNVLGTRYVPGDIDGTDVTRPLWRLLDLELIKPDGSKATVQVTRPLWWLQDTNAKVGETIDLAMHEVGIEGIAEVKRVSSSDADSREGKLNSNIVIGTIEHQNAVVYDLVFNNNAEKPLGVTASHPIFSYDRDDWVPAGELRPNEKVATLDGTATLTSKAQRPGRHTVYNLEVHRAHSFHVSELGILAHNTGIWTCGKAGSPVKNALEHWKKHRAEFPELSNAKQYADRARQFFDSPPTGALGKVRPNGDILIYDPATNTFGAFLADGTPKTFFRPLDGIKYWHLQ